MNATVPSKRCFVVMGFGTKTDLATGRQLDLERSYRLLIQKAVEDKGLVCVRADEVTRSGVIDVPMYRELLTADVVIADLSTANPNALYELGIRHALKPRTTIVIAEDQLPYPFDLNHVKIRSYTHLGNAIDFDEVMRFRQVLGKALEDALSEPEIDSPVYTFLHRLQPPFLQPAAASLAAKKRARPRRGKPATTLANLIEQGEAALRDDRFREARDLFAAALKLYGGKATSVRIAPEPYLVQRLVLATYKANLPTKLKALHKAQSQLEILAPHASNDPETVGLAGEIEEQLFESGEGDVHLDNAIARYTTRFHLRRGPLDGLSLARLLTVRADLLRDPTPQVAIADLVRANRVREDILEISKQELAAIRQRGRARSRPAPGARAAQGTQNREREFTCLEAMAEALFGLGDIKEYRRSWSKAMALHPHSSRVTAFESRIARMRELLTKNGSLLTPPWPGISAFQRDRIGARSLSGRTRTTARAAEEKNA
jgi:tetratricopeptide (TPR) repeat protein